MRILFVHHYFPGQFRRIVEHYRDSGDHEIIGLHRGLTDGRTMKPVDGVRVVEYGQEVGVDRDEDHVLYETEQYIREAASAGMRAEELRQQGWYPDIVYSHTGWGTGGFLHDVFPDAKFVKYCEWFYNNTNEATEFLEPEEEFLPRLINSLLNLPVMADLVRADLLMAPTEWQRAQFPAHMRPAIRVVPDGIDTDICKPDSTATFTTGGKTFRPGDKVVTYVARGADPFRGFSQFIDALGELQALDADVEAIIVGDRMVYYGPGNGSDNHFHAVMAEARIDPARTHFTGTLEYGDYLRVLQVSAAHVYLTVPFVLSWSALEALSVGCMFIGSDTAPVREFVTDGENGLLCGFHDTAGLVAAIRQALTGGETIDLMRRQARQTVLDRWSADMAVRAHGDLVSTMLGMKE